MARRKKTSTFEDLIEIVAKLPWWIGVSLALIFYFWLHHVASKPVSTAPANPMQLVGVSASVLLQTIATFMQYLIPAACLIGAGISSYKKYMSGNRSNNLESDGWIPQIRSVPDCPQCGALMVKRTAKKRDRSGETFWGCSSYPKCRGIRASAE
jgi:ribosomal protein L37AE/L43A